MTAPLCRKSFCPWLVIWLATLPMGCNVKTVMTSPPPPPPVVVTKPPTVAAPPTVTAPAITAAPSPAPLSPTFLAEELLADGWISLFDGQTLFGWQVPADADWQVVDGAIVVTSGKPGLLCTSVTYADYILQMDVQTDATTNSGIFLRTPANVTKEDVATKCYELNLASADNPFPTCSLVARQKAEGTFDTTTWQTITARCEGNKISVSFAGQEVLAYTDENPVLRGHIGLQLNSGKAAFKNIRLKPLGTKPLFNGLDLTGWKSPAESKSKFTVTPAGELLVEDGKGCLETEATFADFVLQLDCQTLSPKLNGGLFFRCIPGEVMNGYESQIQFGFVGGDRTKPEDCGTGGIFRRANARYVVGDDETWVHKTIIADGNRFAVWVNGYQVTDWADSRPANANPRSGLRTEAGTIQIQGHDPTTKVLLKNLQGMELPKTP